MKQYLCLILFIALTSVYADEEEAGAISYNEELFNENIESKPHFIKFFAPWCGHCKRMAPAWQELGKKLNAQDDVVIAKVDCTVEQKLCSSQGVKGYPTIKYYTKDSEGEKYSGPRDVSSLEQFVEKSLGGGDAQPQKATEEEEQVKDPARQVDSVWALTGHSFKDRVAKGSHFIKFFAPWCGHCKAMAQTWVELAQELEKQGDQDVTINEVDCTVHKEVCTEHGVRGYPTLLFFKDGQNVEKYQGARDKSGFLSFINKMAGGAAAGGEADKVPEKAAEQDAQSAVKVLTTDNFEAEIAKDTTFVKFYAPWCGHCKRLAPTWEELAQKYEKSDKVTIAKVDCTTQKDACSKHGVRGYPTLILFQDGESQGTHSGARTLEGLEGFVSSKTSHDEL